jgi:hypothetical protein
MEMRGRLGEVQILGVCGCIPCVCPRGWDCLKEKSLFQLIRNYSVLGALQAWGQCSQQLWWQGLGTDAGHY